MEEVSSSQRIIAKEYTSDLGVTTSCRPTQTRLSLCTCTRTRGGAHPHHLLGTDEAWRAGAGRIRVSRREQVATAAAAALLAPLGGDAGHGEVADLDGLPRVGVVGHQQVRGLEIAVDDLCATTDHESRRTLCVEARCLLRRTLRECRKIMPFAASWAHLMRCASGSSSTPVVESTPGLNFTALPNF